MHGSVRRVKAKHPGFRGMIQCAAARLSMDPGLRRDDPVRRVARLTWIPAFAGMIQCAAARLY
jgi:hypothetical protein